MTYAIYVHDERIICAGADKRGAIYALYHLSETVLGIDPFWYWNDDPIQQRSSISVEPDANGLLYSSPEPSFRYRGWFMNDEDCLMEWGTEHSGHTGMSLRVWEYIFETILRCRGNMVIPGMVNFSDEPQIRLAGRRGLIISQHHCEILGMNSFLWPQQEPYSLISNAPALEAAWQNSVVNYADQEVLWTVGLRGLNDRSYWQDDPAADSTPQAQGALVEQAIDKQQHIVSSFRHSAQFFWCAWWEGVELMESGHFHLPDNISTIWPDDGEGIARDNGRLHAGDGLYLHTMFYNCMANQLSEWVPIETLRDILCRYTEHDATSYFLCNVSCIRPAQLSTAAVMDMAWNIQPWKENSNHCETFRTNWAAQRYGTDAAQKHEQAMQAYMQAPASTPDGRRLGDNAYHSLSAALVCRALQKRWNAPDINWPLNSFPSTSMTTVAESIRDACRNAEKRWRHTQTLVDTTRALIPEQRQDFYNSQLGGQTTLCASGNAALLATALSTLAHTKGDTDTAISHAQEACQQFRHARYILQRADYSDKWQGFYSEASFSDYRHAERLLHTWLCHLKEIPSPDDVQLHWRLPDSYILLNRYQKGRAVQCTPVQEASEGVEHAQLYNVPV